ncbi:hypothetical protein AVEN_211099-1, partial [Araneus ventricosus]
ASLRFSMIQSNRLSDVPSLPARSCGPPGDIEHGLREGDTFTFTSRVTYNCSEGFEIIGRPYRYCQSNGQWSGQLPECRRKHNF